MLKNRQKSVKKVSIVVDRRDANFFSFGFLPIFDFFLLTLRKKPEKKFCFWLFFSFEIFLLVFLPFLNFFADSTEKCLKFYWTFNNFLRTLKKRTAAKNYLWENKLFKLILVWSPFFTTNFIKICNLPSQ